MREIVFNIIELSIWGSAIALFVLAIRSVGYRYLRKSILYLMWIIVFIKFLVPVEITSSLVQFSHIFSVDERRIDYVGEETVSNDFIREEVDNAESNTNINLFTQDVTIPYITPNYQRIKESDFMATYGIWLWFVGVLLIQSFIGLVYIARKQKLGLKPTLLIDVQKELGNDHIPIYQGNVSAPLIVGIVNPKIVLPMDITKYSQETLKYVILHEVEHRRFHDNLINYIALIIMSIHWFNPIIWLSYRFFKKDIEAFCDERVIMRQGLEARKDYANALLECTVSSQDKALCALTFTESDTKKRIRTVLQTKKWQISTIILTVIILLTTVGLFLINGNQALNPIAEITSADEEGYVEAVELNTIVNALEKGGLKLKKDRGKLPKEYILEGVEPTMYTVDDDKGTLLIFWFNTIEKRKEFLSSRMIFDLNGKLARKFDARNAAIVYVIEYAEDISSEEYSRRTEPYTIIGDIVFEFINGGEVVVYKGESEHWEGVITIKNYQYWWKEEDGTLRQDGGKSKQPELQYKMDDIDRIGPIEYSYEVGRGGSSGEISDLDEDGKLSLGRSSSNSALSEFKESIIFNIKWNGNEESIEMKLQEEGIQ